ncbi:MAG: hypothetical protein ABII27_06850 [bacterium]
MRMPILLIRFSLICMLVLINEPVFALAPPAIPLDLSKQRNAGVPKQGDVNREQLIERVMQLAYSDAPIGVEEEKMIATLMEYGTHDPDVQRAIMTLSWKRKIPVGGVFDNFYLDGVKVAVVPDKNLRISYERGPIFESCFPLEKQGMIIETHPDDIAVHTACVTKEIIKRVTGDISIQESEVQEPKVYYCSGKYPFLVTAIPDAAGVSNQYVHSELVNLPAEIRNKSFDEIKQWIRVKEAEDCIKRLQLPEPYYSNLMIKLPVKKPKIEGERLLSYETIFKEPSADICQQIEKYVIEHLAGYYIMVHPFSYHPHHRSITKEFLKAIWRHNRDADIYFWSAGKVYDIMKFQPNVVFLYGPDYENHKESIVVDSFPSQNARQDIPLYYADMVRNKARKAAKKIYKILTPIYGDEYINALELLFPYAERLIKVKLSEWDGNGKFQDQLNGISHVLFQPPELHISQKLVPQLNPKVMKLQNNSL